MSGLNAAWLTSMLVPLDQVPYIDRPSIEIAKGESIEMPFKYVKGEDGKPVMPEVSRPLLSLLLMISSNLISSSHRACSPSSRTTPTKAF